MDPGIELTQPNPIKKANILSKLGFIWMIKFFHTNVKHGMKITDLYKTLLDDRSEVLGDRLAENWRNEEERAKKKNVEPSLYRALYYTFFRIYMWYGLIMFVQLMVFRTMQPVVLGYLLRLFSPKMRHEEELDLKMYVAGTIMILLSFVYVFMYHHANFGLSRVGARVRVAISTLVYRKLLKLNKKSLGQTASGQVVNILSNDVSRFDFVSIALHFIWISPFQCVIIAYLIWDQVGVASLAGILTVALFTVPVQGYIGQAMSKVRSHIAVWTDQRVRFMSEIVNGIQVIKMYAWEKPFEKIVKEVRDNELRYLKRGAYFRSVLYSCMVMIDRGTLYLTVITYVLLGNVITSDKIFSLSQLFNLFQLVLSIYLPLAITLGAETMISIRRIKTFLQMDELEESEIRVDRNADITIENVSALWCSDNEQLTLNAINVRIPKGKLCAIVGPVGAGKSSIFNLLLGELKPKCGEISVCGDISYASQEPWLFVSSVRNNILFGQTYDKRLYQRVTKVCALLPDFDQFPQRDKTLVGERGVSLSGGQRARINLARAVYRNTDIYLLDDPLSAVDTHVGKHLFEECILNYLQDKTRILVTHQLQYLKKADFIIVINEGKIEAQGTFDEISNSPSVYAKMLVAADETLETSEEKPERRTSRKISVNSMKSLIEEDDIEMAEEEIGKFEESVVKTYIKAFGSNFIIFGVAFALILAQVACSGADYFVTYWTNQEEQKHANDLLSEPSESLVDRIVDAVDDKPFFTSNNNTAAWYKYETDAQRLTSTTSPYMDTHTAIYIYTGVIIAIITLTMFRSFAFFRVAINASRRIHYMMFNALLAAPMRFFDTNPSGRILNRFSKDMGSMDEMLPRVSMDTVQIFLVMIGIFAMIIIANYYMIIALVIFGCLFMVIRKWYLSAVRTIKHIEGIAKSPVFSHINSTLNGISTIRVTNLEDALIKEFDRHQDVHTSAWFLTIAATESFGIWIDFICILFTATITYTFIALRNEDFVDASNVGLAISQSLILTGMVQYGVRQAGEVVNQFTSVERILYYTTIEKEGPFDTPPENQNLIENWPKEGHIKFENMFLRYSALETPVLRDLNIDITPGEKIGIVGRTGAGKSSLINALFRLSTIEGAIRIDGLDTQLIGLKDLRKKISIIPQEPVLFSASLRYNLDPFGDYSDDLLWNALEEVELKDAVSHLDHMIDEGGSNFSVGQRQLVCLARAILRNNRILVLDEATANVDPQTDALIQKTIRVKFANCTVLTIAHRLNTIMDNDKVIVMDAGRMIQFDHPYNLLQQESSHFSKMVEQTGPTMSQTLYEVAKAAFMQTHNNEEKDATGLITTTNM